MKAVIGILKQKMVIQLLGIGTLCVLIWFVGPKFAFAGKVPLESEFNRLLAILVVVACWALYNLAMLTRSHKKEQQLMTDLAAPEADPAKSAVEEAQGKEVADLRLKFDQALQLLKTTRSKGWRDKQHIYELPWYIIIGAPGCGKTTLLANSGLRFPLAEQMGQNDIQGVGGTRNCDWLFTDEAIFLDTAGRYTTQDSHQPVDSAAWQSFLGLLKKHRPRRPINGVLVAASVSDLLRQTDEQSRQQAGLVRQRIDELSNALGIRFPVYMLFTKCDLVAGFSDLFAKFNPDERAQVWGETFDSDGSNRLQDHIDQYLSHFDDSLRRLNQWTFKRIQEERDIQRRSLILDFPQQMTLLKPKIKHFLQQTFSTSLYEKRVPLLRGIYLTSGTQEGTPIDRVMGQLAATYGLDRQQAPVFSGRGKSYFITRLLTEVIFPEAQLAGVNPRVERRRYLLQLGAYASVFVLAVGLVAGWSVSYSRNKGAIVKIENRFEQFNTTVDDHTNWRDAVKSLLARLNIIGSAGDVYSSDRPWMGFGLNQGDKLQAGIDRIYDQLLKQRLLPLVKARLEQRIHAYLYSGTKDDVAVLYELLKIYLMLGQPRDRLDPPLAARRISSDWKQSFAREPELHDPLYRHTDNLMHLPLDPIQLNETLIGQTRRVLNRQPLYARIFAHMQIEGMADHRHDFRLLDILPPHSDQVFTTADGQDLKTLTIPGLYTYDGYHGFFAKKGLRYVNQSLRENWVLDSYAADEEKDLPRLHDDLQKLYFDQYEMQWRGLIQNLKVIKARGISQEIQILDILSGPETPLRPLMEAIEQNTTLYRPDKPQQTGGDEKQKEDTMVHGSAADRLFQKEAAPVQALELERRFQNIHYLVRGSGDAPPPLENLLASLNSVRDFMMQIGSAADSDEKALKIALERIHGGGTSESIKAAQMDFARQPEPIKSWLSSLTSSSLEFTLASAKSELNATWKTDVLASYRAALEGRYPIYKNSDYDITFDDFSRFFMPNGTIDGFFNDHLKSFVDTTHHRWRPRRIDNQSMHLSSRSLQQLQNAETIRNAFFAAGGSSPSFYFELKPIDLDDNIVSFRIDIEGQVAEYRHGPARIKKFQWPGPQADTGVRLTFSTIDGEQITRIEEGTWALLRTLDKAAVQAMNQRNRFIVTFRAGHHRARYELRASSVHHPFQSKALENFRCPESL
jgi:type VI secretion system protein ImpL